MKVRIDWTNGHASTFTDIHPQYNPFRQGERLILHSKDGKVTRDINTDKANYISFTEEPDDLDLLAAQPRYVDGSFTKGQPAPEWVLNVNRGQPSPYST